MDINSLLNYESEQVPQQERLDSPYVAPAPNQTPHSLMRAKTQKDMPSYREQKPSLEVKYPAHAALVGSYVYNVQRHHSLLPEGDISDYAARIPYSSSKTQFQEKTGRTAVEVFMYDFRMPDDETNGQKRYPIYWDYNFGLVRMTNIYKACGLPKVVPRKALQMNPGLIDISHSLTGGNLEAQGYWVPFEAARAIATKFAYPIRFLLTPIFGHDFPGDCVAPDQSEYRNYKIDPVIVQRCAEQTREWQANVPVAASSAISSASSRKDILPSLESTPALSDGSDSPTPYRRKTGKKAIQSKTRGKKRPREEIETSTGKLPSRSETPLTMISTRSSMAPLAIETPYPLRHTTPDFIGSHTLASGPPRLQLPPIPPRMMKSPAVGRYSPFLGPSVRKGSTSHFGEPRSVTSPGRYQTHHHVENASVQECAFSRPGNLRADEYQAALALLQLAQAFVNFGTAAGSRPQSRASPTVSQPRLNSASHIYSTESETPRAAKRLRLSSPRSACDRIENVH